jgi:hypothetical protein
MITSQICCRLLVLFGSPTPDHHVATRAGDAAAEAEPDPALPPVTTMTLPVMSQGDFGMAYPWCD